MLHHIKLGLDPSSTLNKFPSHKYLVIIIQLERAFGLTERFHPCLANKAKLKDLRCLKSIPPTSLRKHNLYHEV